MTKGPAIFLIALLFLAGCGSGQTAQDPAADEKAEDPGRIDGVRIYDYDPSTELGDDIFGDIIADLENDAPGRCTHGGPVCMEYADGRIVAFHTNTTDHNLDGWTEYAESSDGGRTWKKYNKFQYSYDRYDAERKRSVWVEEGLVTETGTAVLFLTHFEFGEGKRESGFMRSLDHGSTWSDYQRLDGNFVGYPCAVAVSGETNYVLYDSKDGGPHVLYSSIDDGVRWTRRSTLPLDDDKWYGTMVLMADGRILAGAYTEKDEHHFYYCISEDQGRTWGEQQKTYVDKMIRDPELAYLGGKYYLHGRSGQEGEGSRRFVLYQSDDGIDWGSGIIVSGDTRHPDGYSHNCIINRYNDQEPLKLMVEYSIIYEGRDTNEYVFFIEPDPR